MKKNITISVKNLKETKNLVNFLVKNLKTPITICLYGEVGVGKTQFVKFFASILNIPDIVSSATFAKMQIYQTEKKQKLVHLDGYLLDSKSDLGFFKDYLNEDYVIIEWPKIFLKYLNEKKNINLFFKYNSKKKRTIKIESYHKILDKLKIFYQNNE